MLSRINQLITAIAAGYRAWKQYPAAEEAARRSAETGEGWNSLSFPDGFVDLYDLTQTFGIRPQKPGWPIR